MSGRNSYKAMPSDFLGIEEDEKTPWSWLFDLNQRQLVSACIKDNHTKKWMLAYEDIRVPLFASPDKTPIGTAATSSKIAGHQLSEDGQVVLTSGVGLMPYRHALLTTWASDEDIALAKKRLRIIKRQHAPLTEETKSLKSTSPSSSSSATATATAVPIGGKIIPGTKYAEQIREFECQLEALEKELGAQEEKRQLLQKRAARAGKTTKSSAKSSSDDRKGLDALIDIIRESDRAKLRASQMKRPRYDDDDE